MATEDQNPNDCEGWFIDHHVWSRWEQVNLTMTKTDTLQTFGALRQQRVCKRCGLIQLKELDCRA
jgi:hypothetical protein